MKKIKYFIPYYGFFLILRDYPNGTNNFVYGMGVPAYHGIIGGTLIALIITIFI